MSIKWQKEFATGVIEIDRQHQELFSKLDDLLNAVENGKGQKALADTYSFLDNYTRKHFAAEEGLQRKFNYPHVTLHCEEHQIFLKNLERLKSLIAANGPGVASNLKSAVAISRRRPRSSVRDIILSTRSSLSLSD